MEKKTKEISRERGITLTALVITIILLLILAGITIRYVTGEFGLFERAKDSVIVHRIGDYGTKFELPKATIAIDTKGEPISGKDFVDRYEQLIKEEIGKDKELEGTRVIRISDEKLKLITPDGYVYDVTKDKTEFIGIQGDKNNEIPPTLTDSNLEFKYHPSEPTNGDVTVEAVVREGELEKFRMEYTIDKGKTWEQFGGKILIGENKTISIRLVNDTYESGGYYTANILNIDKLLPLEFTPEARLKDGAKTNTIIVTADAQDAPETEDYASSGIVKYWYSKDNGQTWEPNDDLGVSSNTHEFTGLTQGTTYTIQVKVRDAAGNDRLSKTVEATTDKIKGITDIDVSISHSEEDWSKGPVDIIVDVNTPGIIEEGYKFQWSESENGPWQDLEVIEDKGKITREENGPVYIKISDSDNQSDNTKNIKTEITKIDKVAPLVFTPEAKLKDGDKSNTITVKADVQDAPATDKNGSSGVVKYWYSKDDGLTWEPAEGTTENTHEFTDLTQGETYKVKVKVQDAAGNDTISNAVELTTETVPGIIEGTDVGVAYSPAGWTQGPVDVVVTLTNTSIISQGYKLQWKDNASGATWADLTLTSNVGRISRTINGPVYIKIADRNGQSDPSKYVTANVQKIDNVAPPEFTPTASLVSGSTSSAIRVSTTVADTPETATNGCSGVTRYWYSKDNGSSWYPNDDTGISSNSYDFTGLTGSTTYNLKIKVKDAAGNERISNSVSKTTEASNRKPGTPSVSISDKGTTSITFRVSATDPDGDSLTYKIYVGTSTSNMTLNGQVTGSSGSAVTKTINNSSIKEYTTYYYYVVASDGKVDGPASSTSSVRTYCSGGSTYTCSGRGSSYTCSGKGSSYTCSDGYKRNHAVKVDNTGVYWGVITCDRCGVARTHTEFTNVCTIKNLTNCSWKETIISCDACGYIADDYETGTKCSGKSYPCEHGYTYSHTAYRNCSHGYSYSHTAYYACEHGKTSSHTVTEKCEHGYTSKHD